MSETKTILFRKVAVHQTKMPLAASLSAASKMDEATAASAVEIVGARNTATLSPQGLKKGNYAIPAKYREAFGGEIISVGWYYSKPFIKIDGVKVQSGTQQFRALWRLVTEKVAKPTTKQVVATASVADDCAI